MESNSAEKDYTEPEKPPAVNPPSQPSQSIPDEELRELVASSINYLIGRGFVKPND